METFKIIIIICIIVFLIILFYFLINNKNKIVRYTVIKTPIEEDYQLEESNINCGNKMDCLYNKQKNLYNTCIDCKKKFMCFDEKEYKCKFCLFNKNSCNKYGCFNGPPINPNKNNCLKCWQ